MKCKLPKCNNEAARNSEFCSAACRRSQWSIQNHDRQLAAMAKARERIRQMREEERQRAASWPARRAAIKEKYAVGPGWGVGDKSS